MLSVTIERLFRYGEKFINANQNLSRHNKENSIKLYFFIWLFDIFPTKDISNIRSCDLNTLLRNALCIHNLYSALELYLVTKALGEITST